MIMTLRPSTEMFASVIPLWISTLGGCYSLCEGRYFKSSDTLRSPDVDVVANINPCLTHREDRRIGLCFDVDCTVLAAEGDVSDRANGICLGADDNTLFALRRTDDELVAPERVKNAICRSYGFGIVS